MSHYFYHEAFDFVSNNGEFGLYLEQGNGKTSSSNGVNEEYVIEVHYLGGAVTTLNLDVTNITHSDTLDDLFYVPKGFIGANQDATADGHRYGLDGGYGVSANTEGGSTLTSVLLADGYWNAQQSGLDPTYGLIEINIPNAGATEANGNRDHDYLYLESQLYFDVIQQDSALVEGLQDVIDGDTTLAAFANSLDTATQGFEQVSGSITDASNDITSPFQVFSQ